MFSKRISFALVILFAVTSTLVACGGGGGGQQSATDESPAEPAADPATFGSLTVTANFDGQVPEPKQVDASANSECGVDTIEQYPVVVNDGKVENVVVSVKDGPSGYAVSDPGSATIDQKNCRYQPHVVALKAGQDLTITDSDEGMHNVRATSNGSQLFNETTFQGGSVEKTFDQTGVFSLACDVHPWMSSYVYVTEHGQAAVTDDSGQTQLSELPPGDYELTIWHEELGTQTETVTIGENEDAQLDVTLSS